MDELYLSLVQAQENGIPDQLEAKYIPTLPDCSGVIEGGITFSQV